MHLQRIGLQKLLTQQSLDLVAGLRPLTLILLFTTITKIERFRQIALEMSFKIRRGTGKMVWQDITRCCVRYLLFWFVACMGAAVPNVLVTRSARSSLMTPVSGSLSAACAPGSGFSNFYQDVPCRLPGVVSRLV